MPSLIGRIARFASSPQGRRLAAQAKRYASDPKNRAKIDEARKRLMARDAKQTGHADAQAPPNATSSARPASSSTPSPNDRR